jgi:diguanylate cyclase (GGDEF)-like protein
MRLTTRSPADDGATFAAQRMLSPAWGCFAVVAAVLAIFAADRATGSAPVQHLYYVPIIFGGLRFRLRGALAAALAATVSYHLANPHLLTFRYGESDIIQVLLFLAVGAVTATLTRDARRMRLLASTDDLTGLHNLRSFEARLAAMVPASRDARAPIAMLVLDVDRLKALNDAHGHLAGAEAVRTVGQIIGAGVPHDAVACRYGGDEFVVAIPWCTTARASMIADDLRHTVTAAAPVLAGASFAAGTLSISIGVAGFAFDGPATPIDHDAGERLFRAADAALYRAKSSGRNCTCVG